jgi:anthranilate phosphoribosyltransferase
VRPTARYGTAIAVEGAMLVPHAIKRLVCRRAGERDLTEPEALELFAAILDGGVAELELGALHGAVAPKPRAPA